MGLKKDIEDAFIKNITPGKDNEFQISAEAQKKVDNWIKEYGVRYFNELTNTALLMEEIGELSRHIARKYGEQNYKKKM